MVMMTTTIMLLLRMTLVLQEVVMTTSDGALRWSGMRAKEDMGWPQEILHQERWVLKFRWWMASMLIPIHHSALQCHNSPSKLLQHHQCNSVRLTQQTNKCNS